MDILKHFNLDTSIHFILSLKKSETDNFLTKLPDEFRLCYISDEELTAGAVNMEKTEHQFIEDHVTPDVGNIMSGDFGEMLSYFMLLDKYNNDGLNVYGPKKWRWKLGKNKPAPFTDVILFHRKNKKTSSPDDKLILSESKMRAVKGTKNPIKRAIDSLQNSELNEKKTYKKNMFTWLDEKIARTMTKDDHEKLQRFRHPSTFGTYETIYNAIAITDDDFLKEDLSEKVDINGDINIIVISINKLKESYNETYKNIIDSAKK